MSQQDDIIQTQFVIAVSGVETVSKAWWLVSTVNGADSVASNANALATAFMDAADSLLTNNAILTCVKWQNHTRAEKVVISPNRGGVLNQGSHPQHQVLRFNTYGHAVPGDPLWRNALNLSGVGEELSTRGRLNDAAAATPLLAFLSAPLDTGATGVVMTPQIRKRTGPAQFVWFDVERARINPRFMSLSSRKYRLCV